ncbi:MAG TPA: error-prone DNA polymerase [Acetobacteraceae bacterium]|nr:error-prone DNA polymerase [Acetobacteraceae bacterium]
MTGYAELQVTSNFSFLRGASHVEELMAQAKLIGLPAIGITDRNSLAGIARAHQRAEDVGIRLVVGCRLDLTSTPSYRWSPPRRTGGAAEPTPFLSVGSKVVDGRDKRGHDTERNPGLAPYVSIYGTAPAMTRGQAASAMTPASLSVLVYPTNRAAYARLCRLLSIGKARAGKGACELSWQDLAENNEGLLAILLPEAPDDALAHHLTRLRADFPNRCYLALTLRRRPGDAARLQCLADAAQAARVPTVATGDVLYHTPERRMLQDALTCIREGCTIDQAGFRRERSFDRALKSPAEMARLFARHPEAVARTLDIVERCTFSLADLRYQYPEEVEDSSLTPQQTLERQVRQHAPQRYPAGLPDNVEHQLQHELRLIAELDYAPYFLTVHSIVRFARSKGILCQGRGSAANSVVCYILGITSIDPVQSGLLFERFVSAERKEPPDIDVDFEHERREEVIQWIYERYGRDRAAICATVIRYRGRGAIRDVGKAMGLTEDVTSALARQVGEWTEDGVADERAAELNFNMQDRRLRLTLELARELIGFPRHLSQHPGGFVLTRDRLDDLVPIEPAAMQDRQVIEWDKDDIDILRWMKVDVLGLGMLGCMRRAFDLLAEHRGERLDLATVPPEDTATYAMICKADTIGVFQIESRAQMAMLPRLKPRTFYDLVIEVAIIRPGPIQGDMVHPYLRRREGKEKAVFPTPELQRVLGKTLGVPLFQEQAMQVAIVCAGFTPSEADQLRRSMATFKVTGGISHFKDRLIAGMMERRYTRDFAEQTVSQIEGFGSYGFPESHAASFALIAYASSWMKCHHPDVFCCALLNAQPMGFYAPAQIARDAQAHGVEVRPVSVNHSRWDCTLENTCHCKKRSDENACHCEERSDEAIPVTRKPHFLAVRLGMRMVKGLANAHAAEIVAARGDQPYATIDMLQCRARVPPAALERLAEADAFHSMQLDRRQALWAIRGLRDDVLPLFAAADAGRIPQPEIVEPPVPIVPMTAGRNVVEDYGSVGLTLRQHPVAFLRGDLQPRGILPCAALLTSRDRQRITVAGLVLVRQRPGTATGVVFITIEDETGIANLVVWSSLFDRQRRIVLGASMIKCRGRVQREGEVIHLVAEELEDMTGLLRSVGHREEMLPEPPGHGDGKPPRLMPDRQEVPWGAATSPDPARTMDREKDLRVQTRSFR